MTILKNSSVKFGAFFDSFNVLIELTGLRLAFLNDNSYLCRKVKPLFF